MIFLKFKKYWQNILDVDNLLVGIYVDDLLIPRTDVMEIAKFKLQMKELFNMDELDLLSYYLGIEVQQKLDQHYVRRHMRRRCLKIVAWKVAIQLMFWWNLVLNWANRVKHPRLIQQSVRSLRCLVNSRPDLVYYVGICELLHEGTHNEHWTTVKHILRFIKGTTNVVLSICKR